MNHDDQPAHVAARPKSHFRYLARKWGQTYAVAVRRWFQIVLLAMPLTALAQQPLTGTVVSPHRGQITSPPATVSHSIDEQSCTAQGFLYISVIGNDDHQLNAIVAKLQLIDPSGKRIGPKQDSEDIVNEMASGSAFSWEALDDDEDPNAPPDVPHGVFEICRPEAGTWHLEGKALISGTYSIEIAANSLEALDSRGLPMSTSSHAVFESRTTAGSNLNIAFKYSSQQNAQVSFVR